MKYPNQPQFKWANMSPDQRKRNMRMREELRVKFQNRPKNLTLQQLQEIYNECNRNPSE